MAITLRTIKGSKLTHEELDQNFIDLRDQKLNISALSQNSSFLIKDSAGELANVPVAASRIVGRLASGEVKALTIAEAKALLAILAADISDLGDFVDTKLGGLQLVDAGRVTLAAGTASVSVTGILSTDNIELHHQSSANALTFSTDVNTLVINSVDSEDAGDVFYKVWRAIV